MGAPRAPGRRTTISPSATAAFLLSTSLFRGCDKRLVVSDYFLNEDDFGKIHFEGDHHVRVIKVFKKHLALDRRFDVDFNTAFATGPARPHGVAMK